VDADFTLIIGRVACRTSLPRGEAGGMAAFARPLEDAARERLGEGAKERDERERERENKRHINYSREIRVLVWAIVWIWGVGAGGWGMRTWLTWAGAH
jgi:hypothetical protein